MKHQKKNKKFSRKGDMKALVRNLINSLILHGKIKTTTTRAKYIKSFAEKIITVAKKQNVASLRILLARLPKKSAYKIYYEIAPKYKERNGGYTRIINLPIPRRKDATKMSIIELVE